MDADRRRLERAAEAEGDAEALVRQATHQRREGDLAGAQATLAKALERAPDHAMARALLLLVEVGLGRRTRGSFAEFRHHTKLWGDELVKRLDPAFLVDVALSALDPAQGPVDAEAIEALVASGPAGVRALLEALAAHDLGDLPSRLRIAVALRAREIARARPAPGDVPPELARRALEALGPRAREAAPPVLADWAVLAGAVGLVAARPALERLLEDEADLVRRAAAWSLELLGDPGARPALERALASARPGERAGLERARASLASAPG